MALLRLKRNHEQVPRECNDMEDNDILVPEAQFSVNFLGSMFVPTSNGHGSARTSTAVGRLYSEKYKLFSFNLKKYRLQINNDCLILFDCSGKDSRQVDTFYMKDITYCSTDKKHERAFVFVSQEKEESPYRAFVFHCENVAKAREIFQRVSNTSRVHRNLLEVARMKSLCNEGDLPKLDRSCSASDDAIIQRVPSDDDESILRPDSEPFRRRCLSEIPARSNHNKSSPRRSTINGRDHSDVWIDETMDVTPSSGIPASDDAFDEDDEFTALASVRTKSHQYTGLPHHLAKNIDKPHETASLMNNPTEVDKPVFASLNNFIPFGKPQEKNSPESENLLQF